MTFDHVITELKSRQIPDQWLEKVKHGFKCIGCGNGSGKDGTGAVLSDDGTHLLCGKCGKGFSYIDVAAYHYDIDLTDFVDGVKKLCEIEGISLDKNFKEKNEFVSDEIDDKMKKIINNIIETSRRNLENFMENQGGKWRGLSFDLLKKLNWGYLKDFSHPKNPNKKFPAVIIPNDKGGLFARGVNSKDYSNISPTGTITIFLPHSDSFDLIITEGAINGASIFQAIPAPNFGIIASGGTSGNANVLAKLQQLRNEGKNFRVVIAYDKDSNNAGQKAAQQLLQMLLNDNFIACVVEFFYTSDIDLNDILCKYDDKDFAEIINSSLKDDLHFDFVDYHEQNIKNESATNNNEVEFNTKFTDSKEYFRNLFLAEIEKNKKFAQRKTGFSNIDENQILHSGLYVLGATPACGKTTFCWQLLNQLALRGESCFYCSYEMARLELYSKTVASELFKLDTKTTLSAADIRCGAYTPNLDTIVTELQDRAGVKVIELSDENIDDFIKLLTPIVKNSDKPPVICIDYLQIIPSSKDSTKQGIDDTVRKLKLFQRETSTTFIVVSSFNRTNYNLSVGFESFKESGNIEYSADVVWALQLNITNKLNSNNISDVRKIIDAAKKHQPREIQLKCLKNRSGNNYDCFFKYFSAHDTFEPCKQSDFTFDIANINSKTDKKSEDKQADEGED